MKNHIKFVLSLVILFLLVIACNSDKSGKDKNTNQKQTKDTVKINEDQYRMDEVFTDSKDQVIDLIKGPATFIIKYEGEGKFLCNLKDADGTIIETLANVTGKYSGKKKVDVPETKAYVLDVETVGRWSVYRE
ncbi:MAG: hypothetical protein IT281_01895 [Ignavibacteria bacterium]|nr:hypothetical protein [Ignavibacteria bacterium]MCC7158271.1 hypothetical protein [Ignavibacteria bacterium]